MAIFKTIAGHLLDWAGVANVPAALTALAGLKGNTGQIVQIGGVDAQGGVTELVAVEKPEGGGGSGQNAAHPDWSHLKWHIIGDSLTDRNNNHTVNRYYDFIAQATGIQLSLDGIGGTGYGAGVSTNRHFVERVKNIPDDVDIVAIVGSANDIKHANGADIEIFDTLAWITLNRPGLRCIVVPPPPVKWFERRSDEWTAYYERLKLCAFVCSHRFVSDMYECPPFDPNQNQHMAVFFTTDPEGIHPNEAGHKAMAPIIYNALLQELELENGYPRGGAGAGSGQNVPRMEPADGDTPLVFFTGVKPTTKENVLAEMDYISNGKTVKAFVKIKCQGSSSMNYAKKNFTVTLYQDEAREVPLELEFRDWGIKINKFVLKADWIDHSHSRNICTARIWKDIVESRPDYDTLPEELKNAPGHGAIVGFPIAVYYNGNYEGLYNWNIGKDPWMWGMDEDNPTHAMLCAEINNEGKGTATMCNFQGILWNGIDGHGWKLEIGTNSTALKDSLNALINFVANSDEQTFISGIEEYLDVQSAMDYYCLCYADCGLDGLGKNMTIGTYDGKKWYMGAYDLDCTWLLHYHGGSFVPATYRCPEDYQENANLLFDKFERFMTERLKANYWRLRSGPLSIHNIMQHFERYISAIGPERYADDLTAYPNIPQSANNNIRQIRSGVRDRLAYVDAEFTAMVKPVPATGISLSASTLTIDSKNPVTITATVTPADSTDAVVWESTDTEVATVAGGVVTPVTNGSATIRATAGAVSAECDVTVQYAVVPCTAVTLSGSELTFADKTPQTLTAYPVPTNTTDAVLWESSNPNVATVEGGVVTPVGKGDCTITVTCGNQSATCAVTVSIRESAPLADGVKTYDDAQFKGNITVGDGNHVRVDLAQLNAAGTFNLSDINKGTAVTNQPRIFGLKKDDVVVATIAYSEVSEAYPIHSIRIEPVSGSGIELVRTNAGGASVGTPTTKTVTMTEDVNVGAVSMWLNGMWGDASGKPVLLDFTLSMTVNGVEYIVPTAE